MIFCMELENCKCIKVTKPDFLGGKLNIFKKKLYGPLLWVGFNCLKARATSRRQFTTQFPEIPGTGVMDLGRMKG